MNKEHARKRRGLKAKAIIRKGDRPRLVVYRSTKNIYAQIVRRGDNGDQVIVSCSTKDKALQAILSGKKTEQAFLVGKHLAQRAIEQNLVDVAFDRSGYKYHGRVRALTNGAREAGLNF